MFAHISDRDVEDWQSLIDIVLRRFAEYHDLEGAFGRRALAAARAVATGTPDRGGDNATRLLEMVKLLGCLDRHHPERRADGAARALKNRRGSRSQDRG